MISLAAAATVGYFSASSARYRSCSGERDVVGMTGSFLDNYRSLFSRRYWVGVVPMVFLNILVK